MAEIDQISHILGRLENGQSDIRSDIQDIKVNVHNLMRETMSNTNTSEALHRRVDILEPKVDGLTKASWYQKGALGVLAIIGGGIGSFLLKLF